MTPPYPVLYLPTRAARARALEQLVTHGIYLCGRPGDNTAACLSHWETSWGGPNSCVQYLVATDTNIWTFESNVTARGRIASGLYMLLNDPNQLARYLKTRA